MQERRKIEKNGQCKKERRYTVYDVDLPYRHSEVERGHEGKRHPRRRCDRATPSVPIAHSVIVVPEHLSTRTRTLKLVLIQNICDENLRDILARISSVELRGATSASRNRPRLKTVKCTARKTMYSRRNFFRSHAISALR